MKLLERTNADLIAQLREKDESYQRLVRNHANSTETHKTTIIKEVNYAETELADLKIKYAHVVQELEYARKDSQHSVDEEVRHFKRPALEWE